jgi:hypothetical protein
MYDATPTVKNHRVLYHGNEDGCNWGEGATNRSTAALARIMLAQVGLEVVAPVDKFVHEFIRRRMSTGKMWVLRVEDIRLWVQENQVIQ